MTAVGLALVVGAGVAVAAIPDPGTGLIHGCYSTSTGALRVIDPSKGQKCASGEASLHWNQTGIRWRGTWSSTTAYSVNDAVNLSGSAYIAKIANTNSKPPSTNWSLLASKGATGPPGVSTGVSASSSTQVSLTSPQTLQTVLTSPAVPKTGSYYLNASVMLVVTSGDTVACILANDGTATGEFATVGPAANETYETIPLAGDLSIAAGKSASVQCTGYTGGGSTSFYDGAITATLISSDNAAGAAAGGLGLRRPVLPAVIGTTRGATG